MTTKKEMELTKQEILYLIVDLKVFKELLIHKNVEIEPKREKRTSHIINKLEEMYKND